MSILVICTSDDASSISLKEYIQPIKEKYIPNFDIKNYTLFYNNIYDLSEPDECQLLNLLKSDNIENYIIKHGLIDDKFDVIILEQGVINELNTIIIFENLCKILKPSGLIILKNDNKFRIYAKRNML